MPADDPWQSDPATADPPIVTTMVFGSGCSTTIVPAAGLGVLGPVGRRLGVAGAEDNLVSRPGRRVGGGDGGRAEQRGQAGEQQEQASQHGSAPSVASA